MSDEVIVRFCAPTLAGLKPASLFTYLYDPKENVTETVREVNRRLSGKGLCMIPLKNEQHSDTKGERGRCLLYLYRPEQLDRSLRMEPCRRILKQEGYREDSSARCLRILREHFRNQKDFPHEIGLFLGYPAEDVQGFIDHKGCDYKKCGVWKVYGNVEQAEKTFQKYRKCTDIYCRKVNQGTKMEKLAVRERNCL